MIIDNIKLKLLQFYNRYRNFLLYSIIGITGVICDFLVFLFLTNFCVVRRHLLCPDFAPRFVSAFFFRAQGGAAARHDGGLKEGGARVRRFGPRVGRRRGPSGVL